MQTFVSWPASCALGNCTLGVVNADAIWEADSHTGVEFATVVTPTLNETDGGAARRVRVNPAPVYARADGPLAFWQGNETGCQSPSSPTIRTRTDSHAFGAIAYGGRPLAERPPGAQSVLMRLASTSVEVAQCSELA